MTEWALPLGLHIYLRESSGRKEVTLGGVVASVRILTLDRKSGNVVGRAAGRQLCHALLAAAVLGGPTSLA